MLQTLKSSKILTIVLFNEFCDQFSYWGLQSLLVLYLTGPLCLNNDKAYLIYGTFSALTYMFAIMGGYLADKLLGHYQSLQLGALLATIGNIALIFGTLHEIYIGLAFITCGKAFFMPNNANMLGTTYAQADLKREQHFSYLYVSTNLGSLIGPVIYGVILNYLGWKSCFVVSIVLYVVIQFFLLLNQRTLTHTTFLSNKKSRWLITPFLIIACLIFLMVLLNYYLLTLVKLTGFFLAVSGTIVFVYLVWLASKKYASEKFIIYILLGMILLCAIFFTVEFQIYSSLIMFIKDYVNLAFFSVKLPVSSTVVFEPMAVILFSPLLTLLWRYLGPKRPRLHVRLIIGLLLAGLCFFVLADMAFQAEHQHHLISLYPLLIANTLLGAGEACVMPTLMSATAQFSPMGLKGFLMGTVFFSNAVSGYWDGVLATFTVPRAVSNISLPTQYGHVYFGIAIGLFLIAAVAYFISIFFRKKGHFENQNFNNL